VYLKQITHMQISKLSIYYNLQCDVFSKQDIGWWLFVAETRLEIEEFFIVSEQLHWRLKKVYIESRRLGWAGHVLHLGEKRNTYNILVGKSGGTRPLRRPRHRWEGSIKIIIFSFGLWGYWNCGHSWPIVPASGDSEDDCGEADGM
jgi:hypothetical protein